MADETVEARFTADISDFQSKMQALIASANSLKAGAAEMSSALSSAGAGMQDANAAATNAASSFVKMADSSKSAVNALAQMKGDDKAIRDLDQSVIRLSSSMQQTDASAKRAAASIGDISRSAQQSRTNLLSMATSAANSVEEIGEMVQMAGQFVAAIAKQRDSVVQTQRAFTNFTGSVAAAKREMDTLAKTAAAQNFGAKAVQDAALHFRRLALDAKTTTKEIERVSDALAAQGQGAQNLVPVIEKLHQIQKQAKVTTQDMVDLANMGVASWDTMAWAVQQSTDDVKKSVEAGAISGEKAYQHMINGMLRDTGAAAAASKDLGSEWSRLGTAAANLFGPFIADMADVLEALNKLVEMANEAKSAMQALKAGMNIVGLNAFGPVGGFINNMFPRYASGLVDNPEGHFGMVGEDGPEVMWIPERANIAPSGTNPVERPISTSMPSLSTIGSTGSGGMMPNQAVINVTHQIYLDSRIIAEQTIPHTATLLRQKFGSRR